MDPTWIHLGITGAAVLIVSAFNAGIHFKSVNGLKEDVKKIPDAIKGLRTEVRNDRAACEKRMGERIQTAHRSASDCHGRLDEHYREHVGMGTQSALPGKDGKQ